MAERHGVPSPAPLPPETRLGPVHLQVADLGRSVEWYERVLGMEAHDRTDGRARLGPSDGSVLVALEAHPNASPVPRRGRLGLYHFAILLPDRPSLGRFLAHLNQLGVAAGSADHLVSEALYLTDPDHLGIEVYVDRPRAEWSWNGNELAMASDPLDLASVADSAGGATWTGMPAGTVMGHMHLHVGDLAEAERFYHQGLGLDKMHWTYPQALFLSAGGYHHHLGLNTWAAPVLPTANDAQLLDWEMRLPGRDDVQRTTERLREAGHPVTEGAEGCTVTDPWGTRLRLTS